jgi:hypothetical protein
VVEKNTDFSMFFARRDLVFFIFSNYFKNLMNPAQKDVFVPNFVHIRPAIAWE